MLNTAITDIPDKRKDHLPGEEGIWVFVVGDMMVFLLFFCIFMVYRADAVTLFQESRQSLNLHFGLGNTLVLLISSWFVVSGVEAFRNNDLNKTRNFFGLGFVCGLMFCVFKIFEYSEKFDLGISPQTNDFFMFYFVFTGIHLVHLIVGVCVLGWLYYSMLRHGFKEMSTVTLESSATYWHMVDLLWIVLFPLLYLLP